MHVESNLLALSATPFCWGQFLTVCCLRIPHWVVKSAKELLMYSPPLSSRRAFIFRSDWFSAKALNVLKASKASDLALRGSTKRNLEKSSMKVIQYLYPEKVASPHNVHQCVPALEV